jgi:diguanylate cyclase (GGDEF)-like protein
MPVRTSDSENVQERSELRRQIVRILERQREPIINDTLAVFPFAGPRPLDPDEGSKLCELALQLVNLAVETGEVDPRSSAIAELRTFAEEHGVDIRHLFGLVYLLERTALDEAALDETLGATSEQWPAVAQLVRHASFDCLAALTERVAQESTRSIFDPLTTVFTRWVLDSALEKEIRRAERFGHPFALVLLDVDHLSDLNLAHGYGFGDRILERIGIVMGNFFREHDWVARHGEDTFAVVLPETGPDNAEFLAEQVRKTVEERLALQDHRTQASVPVTVSVAVLIAESVDSSVNARQVLLQAEQAVGRAKEAGRNRVERIEMKGAPNPKIHEELRRRRPGA